MSGFRFAAAARCLAAIVFAALVMPAAGCDVMTKAAVGDNPLSRDVTYSVVSTPSGRVQPGGGQSFFVEEFTEDHSLESGGSDHAPGTWKWSVTGPAAATVVSDGGASAHWTAPQTEGTYSIKARGGTTPRTLTCTVKVTTKKLSVTMKGSSPIVEEGQERLAAPTGTPVKVLETGNAYGIRPGGKAPTFSLAKPATIVDITTYHYIDGGGPAPGTLSLKSSNGTVYGPWTCTGLDGQGGVKNAFWVAKPNAKVPAGTYTVVDSNPATWSTNDAAKGIGFTTLNVVY